MSELDRPTAGNQATKGLRMRLSIGELSAITGCNSETIRYYERIEILRQPPRSAGGHRQYDQDAVQRLAFVRKCRDLGFSLDQVRELLHFVDGGDYTCDEVRTMAVSHMASVKRKIADLNKMKRVLTDMVNQCDGGQVPDCPIIHALFGTSPE